MSLIKKHFLPVLSILISSAAFSQNFHEEVPDTILYGDYDEETFYGDIDLFNDTDESIEITWENIEESVPEGWEISNCDPVTCHPVGTLTESFDLNTTGYLNTHFYPNGVAGSGYVKIRLYETAYPDDDIVLTFFGNAEVSAGLPTQKKFDFVFYPNPATDQLTLVTHNPKAPSSQLYVIDMSGQKVIRQSLMKGLNEIDLSELSPGLYFVQIDNTIQKFQKL